MTLSEIAEKVAKQVGATHDEAYGFIAEAMDMLVKVINGGEDVSIKGLGTFRWFRVPGRKLYSFSSKCVDVVEPGYKLRFIPARKWRQRRIIMDNDEDGMTKLGVVLDDQKTKQANEGAKLNRCPTCDAELDDFGSCPTHGTEPFESRPR